MGLLFQNDLHDEFGSWPLGYISSGGPEFGVIAAVAKAVGDGDDDAFYAQWVTAGDARTAAAEAALEAGHKATARTEYLRASALYATAYHPLYGAPVDPRLVAAFDKQVAALDAGLALGAFPVTPARIPFGELELPGYLIPAFGHEGQVRPLIIFTNGYDATITDMYFASAVAALRRGYHCLLFDGPGQGELLYKQGVPMRPDWEVVIRAVVDFALTSPLVDPEAIVLSGWSLGGYLAPRGASGEHRLAAVVADPGLWSVAAGMQRLAGAFGVAPEAMADPSTIPQSALDQMAAAIEAVPQLKWRVMQRGYWVNGVSDLRAFFAASNEYTLETVGQNISCPVLVTAAENDMLSKGVGAFAEALGDKVTRLDFTAAEGAGEHCEMNNRSLLNERVLDWLDETLPAPS